MKKTYDRPTLSHELALEMLRAAVDKAEDLGVKEVVSIVDVSGALIAFFSIDRAGDQRPLWRRAGRSRSLLAAPRRGWRR